MQKVDRRLAEWKGRYLNMARRATLIKATINSLPTYWFNLYKIPKGVATQIERRRRDFLWANKRLHFLSWDRICLSKNKGGIGLASIERKNLVLLGKWWWKWFSDRGKAWCNIINDKYNLCF